MGLTRTGTIKRADRHTDLSFKVDEAATLSIRPTLRDDAGTRDAHTLRRNRRC